MIRAFLVLLLISQAILFPASGENRFSNELEWHKLTNLPPAPGQEVQDGLAAPFAGVSGDVLLIAGGNNEKFYDHAYALGKNTEGEYTWHTGFQIPYRAAYGVSITVPEGVICIGGSNSTGSLSSVFLMKWDPDSEQIKTESLPSLPCAMSQMAAALVDQKIYLAGGYTDDRPANTFLCLDLSKWGGHDFNWEVLEDFPGPPRLQAIAVGQNAAEEQHFYFFSGYSVPEDADDALLTDGLEYNPRTSTWTLLPDIAPDGQRVIPLHGGSGIAMGTQHILCAGGSEYQILAYHTLTQTWVKVQDLPSPGAAGGIMLKWGHGFVVMNGETEPGILSPEIYYGQTLYTPEFGWINWSVVVLYLLMMVFIGYYFMRREEGTDTFFKGGQNIPWWAAGMSIFATMLSAITYMAIPAKTYATDWKYFIMALTIFIMVWPVVRYYLPFFRKLNVTTAYEYLEKRFNYATRFLSSSLFQVFMVARMALVLFLPSLALTTVTGINIYLCIVLMGVITILYCTMGGVKAVIWGDVIQGFVLLGGAILAVVFMISGTEGGLNRVIEITVEHEKMKMFDFIFDLSSATFWVVLLGGLANNLISYSSDQAVIQRYLTTKNQKEAEKGLWFNGTMSIIISVVFYFIGTTLFALYKTQPQELNMAMGNPDSIFPHFIMTRMPVGVAGLMIAAIFSATMSTVSSNVNSISTAFTIDIYKHLWPASPDSRQLRVARISGIVSGGLGILLALLMATWSILSLFDYFNAILGLLVGGLGGVFVMAIFFPRINSTGAITGFVLSFIILLFIRFYSSISFLLYGFLGITISVLIAYMVSLFTPAEEKDITGLTYKTLDN